jgi:hypothetical protein
VKVKVFGHDPVMKRIDYKVKFPKGYVEPRHTHMCVAGKDLRPGDYVFGWDKPHGPYEYPDGCEVFAVMMGRGSEHVWDQEEFLSHQTRWKAKTAAGKKAVARGETARKRSLEKMAPNKPAPSKKGPRKKKAKK